MKNISVSLKTYEDLKEFLNGLPEEELQKPIIFALTEDTLEDSWAIHGIRTLNETDLSNETDLPELIQLGSLVLQPGDPNYPGGSSM